jgi:hypothetical protein
MNIRGSARFLAPSNAKLFVTLIAFITLFVISLPVLFCIPSRFAGSLELFYSCGVFSKLVWHVIEYLHLENVFLSLTELSIIYFILAYLVSCSINSRERHRK